MAIHKNCAGVLAGAGCLENSGMWQRAGKAKPTNLIERQKSRSRRGQWACGASTYLPWQYRIKDWWWGCLGLDKAPCFYEGETACGRRCRAQKPGALDFCLMQVIKWYHAPAEWQAAPRKFSTGPLRRRAAHCRPQWIPPSTSKGKRP